MGIIAFIILGLLAGAIAKAILPGDDPGGYIVTAVIGIVGALLGGFIAAALFDAHPLDVDHGDRRFDRAAPRLSPRRRPRWAQPHDPHLTTVGSSGAPERVGASE